MKSFTVFFAFLALIFECKSQQFHNSFIFSSGISAGPSASEFSYDVVRQAPGNELSTINRRSFSSDFLYSGLNFRLGYNFKGIGIGFSTTRGTQKDQNIESVVFNANRRIVREDVEDWSNNKSYLGFYAEYNFKLGELVYLTPRVELFNYSLSNKDTFLSNSTFSDSSLNYNDIFVDRRALAFTIEFRFFSKTNQFFFAGLSYFYDEYDISRDYLLEEITGFSSSQYNLTFNLGYSFLLMLNRDIESI